MDYLDKSFCPELTSDEKFKNLVVFSIAQHSQEGYVTMLWQVQPHVAARQLSRLAAYRPLPEEPHLYLSSAGQASGWPGDHGREAAKSQQIRKYAGMSRGAHDQIVIFWFHPLDFVEKVKIYVKINKHVISKVKHHQCVHLSTLVGLLVIKSLLSARS